MWNLLHCKLPDTSYFWPENAKLFIDQSWFLDITVDNPWNFYRFCISIVRWRYLDTGFVPGDFEVNRTNSSYCVLWRSLWIFQLSNQPQVTNKLFRFTFGNNLSIILWDANFAKLLRFTPLEKSYILKNC